MAYNLKNKLVVAVSSRALFDLETENKVFEEKGLDAYRGQLYLDVPIDDLNEQYKLICNHMDNPDGSFKIAGFESWISFGRSFKE